MPATQHEGNARGAGMLVRWVGFVQSRPAAVLVCCVLLSIVSLVYAALGLGFKTNRTDLVHPETQNARDLQHLQQYFGQETDIVVIVEGDDRAQMIAAIETVAREIKSLPQHFEKLCYRIDTAALRRKGLYQLPTETLEQVESRLRSFGPLLVGAWNWMTLDNVLNAVQFHLAETPPDEPLDDENRRVLQSNVRLLESLSAYLDDQRLYQSPWQSLVAVSDHDRLDEIPEYFFSRDGRLAFLRVMPIRDESSFSGLHEPVRLLRGITDRVDRAFADLECGLTGLPILEDDEMSSAKNASVQSGLISLIGVAALFCVAFRALRHPLFAIITLALSACWTLGWVTLTVGHLNVLSVSFIVTLVGLGIDFSILWLSRYECELGLGLCDPQAQRTVARSVGAGIVVGGVTTALAFFTTMLTEFLGLREMGWIAGSGVLLCLIGTFTVLPALLSLSKPDGATTGRTRLADHRPAFAAAQRHPFVLAACFLLVVGWLGFQIPSVTFDYNLLNLQQRSLASVEWEHRLFNATGTSGWYSLSVASDLEQARQLGRQFRELDVVGRVVDLASMIPQDQQSKTPIIKRINLSLALVPTPEKRPSPRPPRSQTFVDQLRRLEETKTWSDAEKRIIFGRLVQLAATVRSQLERVPAGKRQQVLAAYQKRWFGDLYDRLWTLKSVSTPEPVGLADLPSQLVDRYHHPSGKWLIQVFARGSIWDFGPLCTFYREVSAIDPHVTGKPVSTLHALTQMTRGFVRSGWIAFGIIFAAVFYDVRRLSHALLAMTPLVLGCVASFGMMGLVGIPLNPANMIALPLIIGISIDFGVHMIHDFRESGGRYVLRWRLARALGLTSLTTITSFASLIVAGHYGMKSIGLVLSIGVGCCTVMVLFFMPALLSLYSGNVFRGPAAHPEPSETLRRAA